MDVRLNRALLHYLLLEEKEKEMTWIEDLKNATKEVETPRSWIYWAGLCSVAAVVRNKVWVDKQYYKLYPNLYVIFLGPSGLTKGFPVNLAKELVNGVGTTKVITGRSSIEGIIKKLAITTTLPGSKGPITHNCGFINAGEFSSSLVRNPDALTILTDLYDGHYHKEWETTLKTSELPSLKNVNITLLGGINETHFNDLITEKEISGGFLARSIIIQERRKSRRNALLRNIDSPFKVSSFIEYLRELDKLNGQFHLTPEAIDEFEGWYNEFEPEKMEDKTGTANRVHDTILKVAMNVALSKRPELIIGKDDIIEAMNLCLGAALVSKKLTIGTGVSADSAQIRIVMQELLAAPNNKMSRGQLLRKHYGDFSAPQLDNIIDTFEQSKAIEKYRENNDQWFELRKEVVDLFRGILEKKVVPIKESEG